MIDRRVPTTTLVAYLESHGVEIIPCSRDESRHPSVEIPVPEGWVAVPTEVFPHARTVLTAPEHIENEWAPNAVLLHGTLSKSRPTGELLEVAGSDARSLPDWYETSYSTANFRIYRSVMIRGYYRAGEVRYEAATRYVVIDHEYGRFLTQLTVTTRADAPPSLIESADAVHAGLTIGAISTAHCRRR